MSKPPSNKHDTKLSRSLSKVLRHRAKELGFTISTDGYIPVDAILTSSDSFKRYNVTDIQRVVEANDKQRFRLCHRYITRNLEKHTNTKNHNHWEWKNYSFVPNQSENNLSINEKFNKRQDDSKVHILTMKTICQF